MKRKKKYSKWVVQITITSFSRFIFLKTMLFSPCRVHLVWMISKYCVGVPRKMPREHGTRQAKAKHALQLLGRRRRCPWLGCRRCRAAVPTPLAGEWQWRPLLLGTDPIRSDLARPLIRVHGSERTHWSPASGGAPRPLPQRGAANRIPVSPRPDIYPPPLLT